MRNGPVLWHEILTVIRNIGGHNPVIAGGAIRDYALKLGDPKDIDVFIGGSPPDGMQLPEGWAALANGPVEGEYHGQIGTITAIQNWGFNLCDFPVQFIWIGDNDPVHYVRGFDLGTSKCYYRGSVVLGKDFLFDWHHQRITILPVVWERLRNIERSRGRAQALQRRYPNGATIVERPPAIDPVPVMGGMLRARVPFANLPVGFADRIARQDQAMPAEGWIMRNAAGVPGNALENAPAQLEGEVPQERAGLWPNW